MGLLTVLSLAVGLRVWGIDFGLPHALEARPDERELVHRAVKFFEGDFHPKRFSYPSLFYYLLYLCYWGLVLAGKLTGAIKSYHDLPFVFVSGSNALHITARLLSTAFGVATVYVVWAIGKRCFGRRAGFLAALFLAVAYLHARDSHFGVTDVAMTFFVTCGYLPILSVLRGGKRSAYVWTGLVWGLGVSAKYNAAVLGVPLLVAHLLRNENAASLRNWRPLLLTGAIAAVAFVCTSPYSVIDFSEFWGDFYFEIFVHGKGGHDLEAGQGWWHHLALTLRYGLGLPMCLVALAGMVLIAIRGGRAGAVLLSLPLAYYCIIGPRHTLFVRYALPLVPFAALFAGHFCSQAMRTSRSRALCLLTVLTITAPTAARLVQLDGLLSRQDTRGFAARWIERHLAPGDEVGWVGTKYTIATPPSELKARVRASSIVYLLGTADQLKELKPTFVATCAHRTLGHFCKIPSDIAKRLEADYELLVTIDPQGAEAYRDVYDVQDAFFAPYAGFRGVTRPGPGIRVYRRRERRGERVGSVTDS